MSQPFPANRQSARSRAAVKAGFSLIEVMLAVALAASTLLALVALMGQGMDLLRDATHTSLASQITRSVATRLQQASWTVAADGSVVLPASLATGSYFFDAKGLESGSATAPQTTYEARVQWLPAGLSLPGSRQNPWLRQVTIQVVQVGAPSTATPASLTTVTLANVLPEP
jgi:uncharacterized protein (TIGR02598 family)